MNEIAERRNILIIAEGYEEKPYIDKILSFPNINKEAYYFADTINVKGNGNILARYQFEFQSGFYDLVLIFCDVDKGRKDFLTLVDTIGNYFFKRKEDGLKVFIFANPVTLQIVLSHFGVVSLTKVAKKKNRDEVERLTGIKNYDAKQTQIDEMIGKIHFKSLKQFKKRLESISHDFNVVPSTNFLTFLERFESEDTNWIDEINKLKK